MIFRVKLFPAEKFGKYVEVEAASPLEAAEKRYGDRLVSIGSNAQLRASVLTGIGGPLLFYAVN
jgi:hypothetical protein